MNLEFDWEQWIFKLSHSTKKKENFKLILVALMVLRKVQPVPVFYGQLTNYTQILRP